MALRFSEKGDGFPVVLLHGFCENRNIWSGFASKLSKHFRVITPDLPGFGESALQKGDVSLVDIADQVYHWMKSLDIQKAVVIGHSMGGYITLALARKYPEILSGIGLFNSTAYADSEQKKVTRNKTIDFIRTHGIETFIRSFVPPLFYQNNDPRFKERVDWMLNLANTTPEETAITYTKAMRDRNSEVEILQNLEIPILIIAGENDSIVPVEDIYEQELLPKKGIVHILSDTGHMGMLEDEPASLQAVEDFVKVCT